MQRLTLGGLVRVALRSSYTRLMRGQWYYRCLMRGLWYYRCLMRGTVLLQMSDEEGSGTTDV